MATIFKRGNKWWVSGRDANGKRYRRTTRQTNRRAAESVMRAIELEHALPPEVEPLQLVEALDMVWAQMELKRLSPHTMKNANRFGAHLCRVFHRRVDVNKLRPADADRYMAQRLEEGVTPHTIAKELTHLRAALQAARRHKRYHGEPKDLWPPALTNYYIPRDRWLPRHEYAALLREATEHRRDYIVAYCNTGIRYSELYKIKPEHVDLEGRRVFVEGSKTRAAKRWIHLSQDAFDVFSRRVTLEPMFPVWQKGRMNADLKTWCERAGIARCSANDFRRTFASWLANEDVQENVVAKMMGHTNSAMVRKVYSQLSPDTMAAAIAQLPTVPNVYTESVIPIRKRGEKTPKPDAQSPRKRLPNA